MKEYTFKIVIAYLLMIFLASCYEYRQLSNSIYLEKYKGQTEHQILLEWGPATRTTSDGDGGKILEYRKQGDPSTITGLYQDPAHNVYAISSTHTNEWYVEFYINKMDSVYTYRSNMPGPTIRVKVERDNQGPQPPPNPIDLFKVKKDTTKKGS